MPTATTGRPGCRDTTAVPITWRRSCGSPGTGSPGAVRVHLLREQRIILRAEGAIGAILINQGDTTAPDRQDLFPGTLGAPVGLPAVSVSYPQGVAFAGTAGLNVTITTETIAEIRQTENVIAESRWGDPEEVVMVGAHLDTEPDTAGINDNGSAAPASSRSRCRPATTRPRRDGADAAVYAELRRVYRLFGNVNRFAIDTNADAVATAVGTFANDTSSIPPRVLAATLSARAAAARTSHGEWIREPITRSATDGCAPPVRRIGWCATNGCRRVTWNSEPSNARSTSRHRPKSSSRW